MNDSGQYCPLLLQVDVAPNYYTEKCSGPPGRSPPPQGHGPTLNLLASEAPLSGWGSLTPSNCEMAREVDQSRGKGHALSSVPTNRRLPQHNRDPRMADWHLLVGKSGD